MRWDVTSQLKGSSLDADTSMRYRSMRGEWQRAMEEGELYTLYAIMRSEVIRLDMHRIFTCIRCDARWLSSGRV